MLDDLTTRLIGDLIEGLFGDLIKFQIKYVYFFSHIR